MKSDLPCSAMKGASIFRKRIFISWLLTYLLVLFIPISISALVYSKAIALVEEESSRANEAALAQITDVMDSQLAYVRELSLEASMNTDIERFMNLEDPFANLSSIDHFEFVDRLLKGLGLYSLSTNIVRECYVYFYKSEMVLRFQGIENARDFHEYFHGISPMSFDEWRRLMQSFHPGEYIRIPERGVSSTTSTSIAYIRSLPTGSLNPRAAMVFVLDSTRIQRLAEKIKLLNQGNLFILDRNDSLVFAAGETYLPSWVYARLADGKEGIKVVRQKGKKEALITVKSTVTDWRYLLILPYSLLAGRIELIRIITIGSLVVCILSGLMTAYFLTDRNISPVQQLLSLIPGGRMQETGSIRDAFIYIGTAFSSNLQEKSRLENRLLLQNRVIGLNVLARILKGRHGHIEQTETALESFGIIFDQGDIGVALLYFNDPTGSAPCPDWQAPVVAAPEDFAQWADETSGVTIARLENIFSDAMCGAGRYYLLDLDGIITCIVNFPSHDTAANQECFSQTMNRMLEALGSEFSVSATAAMSDLHASFEGLSLAYREALDAMEYRFLKGSGSIIRYEAVRNPESGEGLYRFSIEDEQKLINWIRSGDFEKARSLIDLVVQSNRDGKATAPSVFKFIVFDVSCALFKSLERDAKGTFLDTEDAYFRKILKSGSFEEMYAHLIDQLKAFCDFSADRLTKNTSTKIRERVASVVLENYADINLSLTSLADTLHLNPRYLATAFRGQAGETLLDFIHRVRIRKVKELLQCNLGLSEIAASTGFHNSHALIRVFKKYEGVTPGNFQSKDEGTAGGT